MYNDKPTFSEMLVYEDKPSINELMHEGKGHLDGGHSGRYPWGSGDDPMQADSKRETDFLDRVERLRKTGWTATAENLKKEFGEEMTTNEFRKELKWAKDQRRMRRIKRAQELADEGKGATEIGRIMGEPEGTIRSYLDEGSKKNTYAALKTAEKLYDLLYEDPNKPMIDVGAGVATELGISNEMLNNALWILQNKGGCEVYGGGIKQVTNIGKQINQKVLCKPGAKNSEIYDFDKIRSVSEYTSDDGGETFRKFQYPESMDSSRLMIRYKEDGGIEKDGLIEIRRGVKDLSLGNDSYAQVRILVDNDRYLKGMAVYSDGKDMPDGIDVIFNTNKGKNVPMREVLKDAEKNLKKDPDNPFGSTIKANGQSMYIGDDGKEHLSLINKRASEGDWDDWQDSVPAQFLSKQSLTLAKKQLNLAKADKKAEYNEYMELENPTVKKYFLNKFADECDSAAVHLKAAAFPGQKYHVIIPVSSMKDDEIYAPKYEDGTKLALVRYPHGGIFEIPVLTVNNKQAQAKKMIPKDATDAVGINSKVASQLSGADFDGDTVMCIPTDNGKIKISRKKPLDGLKDFSTDDYGCDEVKTDSKGNKHYYRNGREYKLMSEEYKQKQMGVVSNLITDMTIANASEEELAAAVRHSMVVIDAVKHHLDYKASEIDNNIAKLKADYQTGGASTIISRAKNDADVLKRQGSPKTNIKGTKWYDPTKPEGSLIYTNASDEKLYYADKKYNKESGVVTIVKSDGKKIKYNVNDKESAKYYYPVMQKDPVTGEVSFTNSTGEITYRTKARIDKITKMEATDDAMTLVSEARHPMEIVYAEYANSMKAMANEARKEAYNAGKIKYDSKAKEKYREEVRSLNEKLDVALLNKPKERQAQRMANTEVDSKVRNSKVEVDKGDLKKMRQQAISKYRREVGAVKRSDRNINITDREWEAIQSGAISETKLFQILNNTDTDRLRVLATPKTSKTLSNYKVNKIKAMQASGNYSISEIAQAIGCSSSTVSKYLKGEN